MILLNLTHKQIILNTILFVFAAPAASPHATNNTTLTFVNITTQGISNAPFNNSVTVINGSTGEESQGSTGGGLYGSTGEFLIFALSKYKMILINLKYMQILS